MQSPSITSVDDADLVDADLDLEKSKVVTSSWRGLSFRNLVHTPRVHTSQTSPKVSSIDVKEFTRVVGVLDVLTADQQLSDNLGLLLDSYTYLHQGQFTPAFVLTWTILERECNKIWHDHLVKKGISKDRLQKLSRTDRWSADDVIESLNLLKLLRVGADATR